MGIRRQVKHPIKATISSNTMVLPILSAIAINNVITKAIDSSLYQFVKSDSIQTRK